jgi:hypothetical protein
MFLCGGGAIRPILNNMWRLWGNNNPTSMIEVFDRYGEGFESRVELLQKAVDSWLDFEARPGIMQLVGRLALIYFESPKLQMSRYQGPNSKTKWS